jgi:C4-dicarboxylate transporter DctQ subunit
MRAFVGILKKVSRWMNSLAGIILFIMMMLTVTDVVLRIFDKPIVGTYELVAVLCAVAIGYAIPQTSLERGHIYVDFLIENRAPAIRNGFFIFTRLLGISLFFLLAWNLFLKGNHLYMGGDVSQTLHVPYYPVAYALVFCCIVECFVLMTDIARIFDRGEQI